MRLRRRDIPPARAAYWTLFGVALLLAGLDRCPIKLDAGDPEAVGRQPVAAGRSDVALVVDPAEVARGVLPGARTSWAWVDILQQEVGPYNLLDVTEVSAESLQSHRFAIVSASASQGSLDARVGLFRDFVSGGGTLLVEVPAGALRAEMGADGAGGWRVPGAVTAVVGTSSAEADALRRMPLMTRYLGSTGPAPEAETLLALDGAPVVYRRPIGEGWVVVFEFAVTEQIVAMQQGRAGPLEMARERSRGNVEHTSDLVSDGRLVGEDAPLADVLERFVVHVALGGVEPLFSFWPWPGAGRGALVVSHDTVRIGGRPLWQSIHERTLEARTTTFVAAPGRPPAEGELIADAELAGHAALLWALDPSEANLFRSWGVLGFEPVIRPLTLAGQLERLEAWLGPEADVLGVRTVGGSWTSDPRLAHRVMEAVEFRYSASYGPGPASPGGYVFGTCQPFSPLDAAGLPFRLREVPVCVTDVGSPEARAELARTLGLAAENHWATHLLTRADSFAVEPDMETFDAWRDALAQAREAEMWIGGAGELVRFRRQRAEARLRVISRSVAARGDGGAPRSIEYTVEAETSVRGLTLLLPGMAAGLPLTRATRGGAAGALPGMADEVTMDTIGWRDGEARLLALNPGFTTVTLRYGR